jgi:hypothetical protein
MIQARKKGTSKKNSAGFEFIFCIEVENPGRN